MGVVDQLCLLLFLRVSVTHTHAHTHPFNGLFSGTTRVRNGTTRRHRFGAANSATRQFGAGPTRRGRFGAGTFRRLVSNGDINFQAELQMDHPTRWKFIGLDGLKKKSRRVVTYSMSNWSPDTLLLGSFDDIDCVTKESNGLCKALQTTASWTICVDSPTISR